jgi:hypothetical protein
MEHVREDVDEKRITNKNQENQRHKKPAKTLKLQKH